MSTKVAERPQTYLEAFRDATSLYGVELVRRRKLKPVDVLAAHDYLREQHAEYGQVDPRVQTDTPFTR